MKFGQTLMCCMKNISKMFLAQCWILGTSSRPFYEFTKMAIWDPAIFNSWNLPFSNVLYSTFQKNDWNLDKTGYLGNWSRLLNWKGTETWPLSFKLFKRFLKIIALVYNSQLTMFGDLVSCGLKNIFKNAPCLMY